MVGRVLEELFLCGFWVQRYWVASLIGHTYGFMNIPYIISLEPCLCMSRSILVMLQAHSRTALKVSVIVIVGFCSDKYICSLYNGMGIDTALF